MHENLQLVPGEVSVTGLYLVGTKLKWDLCLTLLIYLCHFQLISIPHFSLLVFFWRISPFPTENPN